MPRVFNTGIRQVHIGNSYLPVTLLSVSKVNSIGNANQQIITEATYKRIRFSILKYPL
jgi:hypothetical protein